MTEKMYIKVSRIEQNKTLPNYALRNVSLRDQEEGKTLFNVKTPDDDAIALMAVMVHLGYTPLIQVDGKIMTYGEYEESLR